MFAIVRLQYLYQYSIHFKLSYIFGFLTSIQIHMYITHTYKEPQTRCQVVEQKTQHFFFSISNLQPPNLR